MTDYFADPAYSRSDLALYLDKGARTLEAKKAGLLEEDEESMPLLIGSFTHQQVLEPHLESNVVIIPESVLASNGHRRGKLWDEYESANNRLARPKVLFKREEYNSAMGPVLKFREHFNGIISNPKALREFEIYWKHEPSGLSLRAKLDLIWVDEDNHVYIPDFKTCANLERFREYDVNGRNLWLQHSHYRAAIKAKFDLESTFFFACCEKDGIFRHANMELDDDAADKADRDYEALLLEVGKRVRENNWIEERELGTLKISKRQAFGWRAGNDE